MSWMLRAFAAAGGLLATLLVAETASAQKPGGVLQVAHRDSPASMSTLEEVPISTVAPMMAACRSHWARGFSFRDQRLDHTGSAPECGFVDVSAQLVLRKAECPQPETQREATRRATRCKEKVCLERSEARFACELSPPLLLALPIRASDDEAEREKLPPRRGWVGTITSAGFGQPQTGKPWPKVHTISRALKVHAPSTGSRTAVSFNGGP
jgi:hypothetical protein